MKFWNLAPSLVADDVLDMYVYGDIMTDQNWMFSSEDDVVSREFLKDLKEHPNAKRINVYINSGGGEVFAALTITQHLMRHPAEVHTYVDSLAASAATLISMAGDVRHMNVGGLYMIHLPSMRATGNRNDIAHVQEVLQKVEDAIKKTYLTKSKLDEDTLTSMLEQEKWLDAYEALEYGFIDVIDNAKESIEDIVFNLQEDLFNMSGMSFKISAYTDPKALTDKITTMKQQKTTTNNNEGGSNNMTLEAILNSLPEDQRSIVNAAITSSTESFLQKVLPQMTAEKEKMSEQIADLTNQVSDLTTQLTEAQAKNSVMTEDEVFLNSLSAEAREAVVNARQATLIAQQELERVQNEKNYAEFVDSLKAFDSLPLQDEHYKALFAIKNSCSEEYAQLETLLKVSDSAISTSMVPAGVDGEQQVVATTAYDELEQRVAAKMKQNEALDYNEAYRQVVKENPDLYNRYQQER